MLPPPKGGPRRTLHAEDHWDKQPPCRALAAVRRVFRDLMHKLHGFARAVSKEKVATLAPPGAGGPPAFALRRVVLFALDCWET
jgi:hypothetical protein